MISVVINYCNNDFRFIEENLSQVSKFSNNIIVCFYDCALDGTDEDSSITAKMLDLLDKYDCSALPLAYDPESSSRWHHNRMRWEALKFVQNEYVLFLDADEILQGDLVKEYLETKDFLNYDIISFSCYWYFREKIYRATTLEQAGTICRKSICSQEYMFSQAERWEYRNRNNLRILENLTFKNTVLCHHYSWVRTKEEMIKKVKTWGHRGDRDWLTLIEDEFSDNFKMKDFVHNYKFEIV